VIDVSVWPVWPLQFGALLDAGLALVVTALAGEMCRRAGIPRVAGYTAAGLLLGPLALGWFDADALARYRGVVDLCIALILFELGIRLDVRWFRANPKLLGAALADVGLTLLFVFGALSALGTDTGLAFAVAAIAVASSPVVVMRVATEGRASGQLTDRLLALCALNLAASVILLHFAIGGLHSAHHDWLLATMHPLYQLGGSVAGGILIAAIFGLIRKHLAPASEQGSAAIIALMLLAVALLTALRLPNLLAPLFAGVIVKWRDPRPHVWPPQFGSVGGLLVIITFMLAGSVASLDLLVAGFGTGLIALTARAAAKLAASAAMGPATGLTRRHSIALGLALMPLSVVALLQAVDMRNLYPVFGEQLLAAVLGMTVVLGILGPITTSQALADRHETHEEGSP
jgi:Kef-type K+ transport system membrane component KefB